MRYNAAPPGIFQNHAIAAMNGSLWTIPIEVFAYILLAMVFIIGAIIRKTRTVILVACIFILINQISGNAWIFTNVGSNLEIAMLAPCFAIGAIFALYKDKININLPGLLSLWAAYFFCMRNSYDYYFFYLALFYTILFVSSLKSIKKLELPFDPSYGIYLWGWPVQQIMIHYFSQYGVVFNQISSITTAIVLGSLSWILIEKRFIFWGHNLFKKQVRTNKE
jgi:peptidoglycan/LPS O-acetylase OafA/YrhL